MINCPRTFSFPRKSRKGPGLPTDPVIVVLLWFVITYKLAPDTFPHQLAAATHTPLLGLFLSYQGVENALSIRSLGSHRVGILSCLHLNSKAIPLSFLKKEKILSKFFSLESGIFFQIIAISKSILKL